jgi:FkbM family methyltransferase
MGRRLRDLLRTPLRMAGFDVVRRRSWEVPKTYNTLKSLGLETVIDVGAHEGEFAHLVSRILPDVSLIAFEPQPEQYARLSANPPRVRSFSIFNCALGDHAGVGRMRRSVHTQTSSLLPMADLHRRAFPETDSIEEIDVDIRTLDDALGSVELVSEVLVKLDVQGFEDRVIRGGLQTIANANAMLIEVSFHELYEGQWLFDGIYRLLAELGFEYHGALDQLLDRGSSRILSADALFLRTARPSRSTS